MSKFNPITPGKIFLEEFLKPMEISRYRLTSASVKLLRANVRSRRDFWSVQRVLAVCAQAAYDTEVHRAHALLGK